MVSDLIKENRRLKRQLERLVVKGVPSDSGSVERSLRSLQRRVERAVSPVTPNRRRGSSTSSRRRRRSGSASA